MNLHDWFLKQRVTQAHMDRFQDHIMQGLGMFASRCFGQEFGFNTNRGGTEPGSIVNGGEPKESATPDKFIRGSYLICMVASEAVGSAFTPPTGYDDSRVMPILGVHGNANVGGGGSGYDSWTLDFTTQIAAITSGQFNKYRVYAVPKRVESEPYVDGDGNPGFLLRLMDMDLEIDTGTEGASAGAAVLPTIRDDGKSVHICTVGALTDTTTAITDTEIQVVERMYNGLTLLGGGSDKNFNVGRKAITVQALIDDDFSVSDATEVERVITLTHSIGYNGIIQEIAGLKRLQGTNTAWNAFQCDTDMASLGGSRRKGRRRDFVMGFMLHSVRNSSSVVPVASYDIMDLGMSDGSNLAGLKANTCDYRYRVRNATGASIFVTTLALLIIIDNRGEKLFSVS